MIEIVVDRDGKPVKGGVELVPDGLLMGIIKDPDTTNADRKEAQRELQKRARTGKLD